MKKIQLFLLSLLLALPFNGYAQQSTLYGDVNGDNEVNIADINFLINLILDGNGFTAAADVNGDGEINIADIYAVIGVILNVQPIVDDHDWVDLGLPSGTLWATRNVGASSPEDYGDYFAWGETEPKDYYDWSTYKWCNGSDDSMTKYYPFIDGKTELDPEDDAAYVNWGPSWRMPTTEQQKELCEKCSSTWTTLNGVSGRLFTGPNGNTLFLPAAGHRWYDFLSYPGTFCSAWSRTLSPNYSNLARCLYFDSGYVGWNGGYSNARDNGFSVRAVRVSQN